MTKNVGGAERVIRALVGLAIIGWGVWAHNWWGAIGVIPLFTALIGWCPPYSLLGINTAKKD